MCSAIPQEAGSEPLKIQKIAVYCIVSLAATVVNGVLTGRFNSSIGVSFESVLISETYLVLEVFCVGLQIIAARHIPGRGSFRFRQTIHFFRSNGLAISSCVGVLAYLCLRTMSGVGSTAVFLFLLTAFERVLIVPVQAFHLRNQNWFWLIFSITNAVVTRVVLSQMGIGDSVIGLELMYGICTFVVGLTVFAGSYRGTRATRHYITDQSEFPRITSGILGIAGVSLLSSPIVHIRSSSVVTLRQVVDTTRPILFAALLVVYLLTPQLSSDRLNSVSSRRWFRRTYVLAGSTAASLGFLILLYSELSWGNTRDSFPNMQSETSLIVLVGNLALASLVVPAILQAFYSSRVALITGLPVLTLFLSSFLDLTTYEQLRLWCLVSILFAVALNSVVFSRTAAVVQIQTLDTTQRQLDLKKVAESVSIVIPSFNPGIQIGHRVTKVITAMELVSHSVEVIVVSDGSTDESIAILDALATNGFRHIHLLENEGKGNALKVGLLESKGEVVGFIDADDDIEESVLSQLIVGLKEIDADVAFASKRHLSSDVRISLTRKTISKVFQLVLKVLFTLKVSDTQTGAKVFKGDKIRSLLPVLREKGFSFDLEVFVAGAQRGHKTLLELPVSIVRTGGSSVNARRIVLTGLEVLRIFVRSRILLEYEATETD